jgi:hypothetical protein
MCLPARGYRVQINLGHVDLEAKSFVGNNATTIDKHEKLSFALFASISIVMRLIASRLRRNLHKALT